MEIAGNAFIKPMVILVCLTADRLRTISNLKKFNMKKFFLGTMMLAAMTFLFSACMKNDDSQTAIPAGGLMAFNLSTDADGVGLSLDGNNLVSQPLQYTNYTGTYLPVYTGNRTAWAYDFYSGSALTPQTSFTVVDSQYYSLFVVSADSNFKTVVVNDSLTKLSYDAGHAFVRYINAVADSTLQPQVVFTQGGTALLHELADFAHVSAFSKPEAGNLTVAVSGSNGVDVSRTFEVEANKIYTVLLMGKPGETGDKAVQIKYIVNGTVDDNSTE